VRVATFALDACILLFIVGAAAAQDRMPPIPKDKMTEAQKKAFDEVTSGPRGAGGAEGPFVPLPQRHRAEAYRIRHSIDRQAMDAAIRI